MVDILREVSRDMEGESYRTDVTIHRGKKLSARFCDFERGNKGKVR